VTYRLKSAPGSINGTHTHNNPSGRRRYKQSYIARQRRYRLSEYEFEKKTKIRLEIMGAQNYLSLICYLFCLLIADLAGKRK